MKLRINICHIYLFVILLCALNGLLYPGGSFVAQALQYVLILSSMYFAIYANVTYKLPFFFKALNALLIMFTIYGMLFVLSGESLYCQETGAFVPNTAYLKAIYKSLLPIYAFYVFARKGLLVENTIRFWFFVFLVLIINAYYRNQARLLMELQERGSSFDEATNNVGYSFVALLPAIILFRKKPLLQYVLLLLCGYFILSSMKRGAILCGTLCLFWFLNQNYKTAQKNRKWIIAVFGLVVIIIGIYYVNYLLENSAYFVRRIEQVEEGNSSHRDELYTTYFYHFINENNPFRLLFGNGAWSTLKFGSNFAHNDWLEIAIGQGLLGIVLYLVYWVGFYCSWRRTKNDDDAFIAIGMLFFIYFLQSFFSMSYDSVSRSSAIVLGYYLARGYQYQVIVKK